MMKLIATALVLMATTAHAATIGLMVDPLDLDTFGASLYVADLSSGIIWRADTATNTLTKFATQTNIQAIAAGPDGVYVCAGQRVYRVTASGSAVYAGSGAYAYVGDGGPATSASFRYCRGLALDAAGNLYLADSDSWAIRKVNTAGLITTIAGGSRGNTGDGGPATAAKFLAPYDVALGPDGSVYVLDRPDFTVRRIAPNGIISTFAGQHMGPGFSGDGGPATAAALYYPTKVAVDAVNNVYVLDSNNNRIRRVNPATGIITTIAGNGSPGTSGDGGPATSASLLWPSSLAVDSTGVVYVGNRSTSGQTWDRNNAVRVVSGGVISTLIGYSTQPAATSTPSVPPTATIVPPSRTPSLTATAGAGAAPTCEPGCRVSSCQP